MKMKLYHGSEFKITDININRGGYYMTTKARKLKQHVRNVDTI